MLASMLKTRSAAQSGILLDTVLSMSWLKSWLEQFSGLLEMLSPSCQLKPRTEAPSIFAGDFGWLKE
eukprot:1159506-Pelagomonas_calceolata.AAC.2